MIKFLFSVCLISFCSLFSTLSCTNSLYNSNIKSINFSIENNKFNNLLISQAQHQFSYNLVSLKSTNDVPLFDFIDDNIEDDEESHNEFNTYKKNSHLAGSSSFTHYNNIELFSCYSHLTMACAKANYCQHNITANKYALFCVFRI